VDELLDIYASEKQYDRADALALATISKLNERKVDIHPRYEKDFKNMVLDICQFYSETDMDKQGLSFLKQLKPLLKTEKDGWNQGWYASLVVPFFERTENYDEIVATLRPIYDEEVEHSPDQSFNILSSLGFAYSRLGKYDEALTILHEAVSLKAAEQARYGLEPQLRAWTGLTFASQELGKCQETQKASEMAIGIARQLDPTLEESFKIAPLKCEAQVLLKSGITAQKENRNTDAERLIRKSIEHEHQYTQKPGVVSAKASTALVKLYIAEKRFDEANEVAVGFLRSVNSHNANIHLYSIQELVNEIVGIYIENKSEAQGMLFFKEAQLLCDRENDPYDNGFYIAAVTDFFLSLRKYDELIATLVTEYKEHPQAVGATLGFAYAAVGRDDEGEALLKQAITEQGANHDLYEAWKGLAVVHYHKAQCSAGRQAEEKAEQYRQIEPYQRSDEIVEGEEVKNISNNCADSGSPPRN
jgi:tetratricopeptide (TPR) repeat protein